MKLEPKATKNSRIGFQPESYFDSEGEFCNEVMILDLRIRRHATAAGKVDGRTFREFSDNLNFRVAAYIGRPT